MSMGGARSEGGAGGAAGNDGMASDEAIGTGGSTSTAGGSVGTDGGASGGVIGSGGSATKGGSSGSRDAGVDPCGPDNPATVPLPVIGSATFDVQTYNAVGDGKTDDTKALQAALAAAGNVGGGTVTVPAGTYLSGPIVLSSGTRLDLAQGATLRMLPMASYGPATAFITANNTHDIALTGSGTIDGQGQAWWTAFASNTSLARPQEVSFSNSTRVQISGLRFQDSPEEHIWVKGDTNVTITGITISTLAVSGQAEPKNTDGVDIGANGVFFCNNNVADGDDNVVIGGSKIYIGYSTFGVGHGCSIGSITKNGVSDVTVDHLTMNGTAAGIRMKSARDRGGLVKSLTYSNITMTNVQNPVYITSYYPTMPTDPTTDTAQTITATTPQWQNITIKNVTATGSSNGGILWGLPEAKISTVVFDNVHIAATAGMKVFHAAGISFLNGSTVTPKSGAAVTTYDADVTGIATTAY
jgi:polygalacturonase